MTSKLPPSSLREINKVCDLYEDEWLQGERPSIEEFAINEDSHFARQLFSDLLDLHLHYCHARQLDPELPKIQANLPRFARQLLEKAKETDATHRDTVDASIQETLQAAGPLPASKVDEIPELSRYKILSVLGRGAMGAVYLAEDTTLGRKVALKTPLLAEKSDLSVQRFFREARAAAGLHNRNICPVYDVGQEGDTAFLTMAYIQGKPLDESIKSGERFTVAETVNLIRRIALALHTAHEQGVVHRDLKPSNIMIDHEGEPIVMDFGLARQTQVDDATQLTHSGVILGTPAYMSPEQLHDSASAGPSADIFSLGVLMYQIITGDLPFKGSIVSVVTKIVSEEPPRPSQVMPGVDPTLEQICLKAICKDPGDRFSSMQEFADALADVSTLGSAPRSQEQSDPERNVDREVEARQPAEHAVSAKRPSLPIRWIVGCMIGFAAVFFGVVVFLPTPKGMIRVEVLDPRLDVVISSTGAKIQGEGTQTLYLDPGDQSFRITRGDFEFETDNFVVRKDDAVQVKIDWVEGTLVAKKDGDVLETKLLESPKSRPAANDPAQQTTASRPEGKPTTTSPTKKEILDGNELLEQMRKFKAEIIVKNGVLLPPSEWQSLTVEPCEVSLPAEFALTKHEMALLIARLPGLYALTIDGNQFESAAIELVRGSGIRKLSLERCPGLPPGAIEQISQLDNIDELYLYGCKIDDADLAKICTLKQLKVLQIGANEITSEGFKQLSRLANLEVLFGSILTEDPEAAEVLLEALRSCKNLRQLGLIADPGSDLSALREFQSLEELAVFSMGKPILDLSPIIETGIKSIEIDSYDAKLHRDVMLRAKNLEAINRMPVEEFFATQSNSPSQDE